MFERTKHTLSRLAFPSIIGMGVAVGLAFVPTDSGYAWDCEKNACDVTGGDCQLVKHDVNCDEVAYGCDDASCEPEQPGG